LVRFLVNERCKTKLKMKKIILSLFMLVSFTAFSQSSLSVQPDSHYYSVPGETCTAHFDVTNTSDKDVSVIVTKYQSPEDTIMSTFCWGITCYGPDTDVSPNAVVIPAGESFDGFSGYLNDMPEESAFVINYCFALENDSLDKVCTDVTFTSIEDLSVHELSVNYEVYPNPVKDVLHIDYNTSTPAEFSIYDMLGNRVYDDVLTSSMSLNLSSFEPGIYFYTLRVQGKEKEVQKLVITH